MTRNADHMHLTPRNNRCITGWQEQHIPSVTALQSHVDSNSASLSRETGGRWTTELGVLCRQGVFCTGIWEWPHNVT